MASGSGDDHDDPDRDEAKEKLRKLLTDIKKPKKVKLDDKKEVKLARPAVVTADPEAQEDVKGLDPEVVHAVHRVAHSVADPEADDDVREIKIRRTESDLLKKLRSMAKETEEAKTEGSVVSSLTSLVEGMKVRTSGGGDDGEELGRKATVPEAKRKQPLTADQMAFLEKRRKLRSEQRAKEIEESYQPVDIFRTEPPMGIFDPDLRNQETRVALQTWERCRKRELKILRTPPPRNFLEDMAIMTDQGVLWHFPIDNEQGVDPEDVEPFHHHVFLEPHLDPWCPKKGPLRHFMELVCVGLSKNSHISAQRKVDHIIWYKNYFMKPEHKEILQVSGAFDE